MSQGRRMECVGVEMGYLERVDVGANVLKVLDPSWSVSRHSMGSFGRTGSSLRSFGSCVFVPGQMFLSWDEGAETGLPWASWMHYPMSPRFKHLSQRHAWDSWLVF